jgi:hypothetical protein
MLHASRRDERGKAPLVVTADSGFVGHDRRRRSPRVAGAAWLFVDDFGARTVAQREDNVRSLEAQFTNDQTYRRRLVATAPSG